LEHRRRWHRNNWNDVECHCFHGERPQLRRFRTNPLANNTTIGSDPLANNFVPVPGWLDNGDSLAFLYQWVYTLPNLEHQQA
jgi:hypothetical protein